MRQCFGVITRRGNAALAALALFGAIFIATDASATDDCAGEHRISGGLKTHAVPCPTLCTAGTLTGDLAGNLEFTMTAMNPTSDPDIVTYEGVITITTRKGTISGPDTGVWNLATGEFVDLMRFQTGTGHFEGFRGSMSLVGEFDPVASVGQSRYTGKLKRN